MSNWTIREAVDLSRRCGCVFVHPNALMVPGDNEAHVLKVEVRDKGQPVDMTGYSASASFTRFEKEHKAVMLPGEISGNTVVITFRKECYKYPGALRVVVRITKDDQVITLCEINFNVRPAPPDTIVDPENIIPSIEQIVGQYQAMREITEEAREAADEANEAAEGIASIVNEALASKVDDAYVDENGCLWLTAAGEPVVGPLGPFAGGGGGAGGGGASNNAVLTLTNQTGWLAKTVAKGASCVIKVNWSSLEDGLATGNGILTVTVGGTLRLTRNAAQGEQSVDVTEWLNAGSNAVRVKVTDVYGNARSVNYTVNAVDARIESSFDPYIVRTGAFAYTCVPTGNVEKTVHFALDGEETAPLTVTTSGRQVTFNVPAQAHGFHMLRCWYTAEIEGEEISSNVLSCEVICVEDGNQDVIIASNTATIIHAKQYERVDITYRVYNPAALETQVRFTGGPEDTTVTVDRSEHVYSFRPMEATAHFITAYVGEEQKKFWVIYADATEIDVSAETDALALYLTAEGRSNAEDNPGQWSWNSIQAAMTGFNYTSNGWMQDDQGNAVLRLNGDARVTIPVQPFSGDFRTSGKTIEIELATRDVLDYDAVILDCFSGDRGIRVTAQKALLKSEQSEISTQYKEDEHLRIAFVVEKRSEHRLIYIYINGIMSGVAQYPDGDDFSQSSPVNITIGSSLCTTDIYCIRIYDNNLTRYQVLDNWIADTPNIEEKLARYERNRIFDSYGQIVIEQLPADLPYLVLEADALPSYKGNKLPVEGRYTDPQDETRSFTFTGAEADVQGTTSAGYARKNYKIKFNGGFVLNGVQVEGFDIPVGGIPTNVFTFKADVASSEGANNVELVRYYNTICPYKTPPQIEDSNVRQGIDGFPIVIFHDAGDGPQFVGKYNFNHDKATPEIFGFTDGCESWEIRNNTSNRVIWKDADFSGTDWLNDFEGRYPDGNTDPTNLAAFAAWILSTDRSEATDAALSPAVTYGETTYDADTAEYRLAKFVNELDDWAEKDSALFYYLFTELFLMVDSRAKNAFPSRFTDGKWCWLPYDMDTAIGINNEGALAFSYHLEDTDKTESGADVYNGQNSVMWINLREAFGDEIKAMYQELRSSGVLSYAVIEKMYEDHQSKWPEAIWNEDAFYKYLQPLIDDGTGAYLSMLQGSKAEQRKWWLYNRFRYLDAKYNAGDSLSDIVTLRGYAKSDITLEPYADIYASIKYGSYLVQTRALRGKAYTLACPLDNVNDTEIYIYSASQIKSIGDLSGLKVGYAEFSLATRLQSLKLGDASEDYSNSNLTELYLGNNGLLKTLDVRNCPNLGTGEQQAVDLSGCANIEHVYMEGTSVKSCILPNGGILKTLHLPETISNLTIRNQSALSDFTMPGYSNIATLRLENVSAAVDSKAIFDAIASGSRVRLIGIDWTLSDADGDAVLTLYDRFDTMRGLDENGNNTEKAQISGKIHIDSITGEQLATMQQRYPNITVTYDHIISKVYFYTHDGATLLHTATSTDGADVTYSGSTPTRSATAQYEYSFAGWSLTQNGSVNSDALKNVSADRNVYAAYTATTRKYTVYFYNGNTLLQTVPNVAYGSSATYTGDTPVSSEGTAEDGYEFTGFVPTGANITGNTSCYAQYTSPVQVVEITDDWETIRRNVAANIQSKKYSVGNYKTLDLGSEGAVTMQIVAMGKDELESGEAAPITWVARELLTTSHRMNPSVSGNSTDGYAEGTGTIGGWEKSEMRSYLKDTIKPLIPSDVMKQIGFVKKYSNSYDVTGAANQICTLDDLWIPSYREIYKSGTLESAGPMYSTIYPDNASRIKMKVGATSATYWWLRSAGSTSSIRYVHASGGWYNNGAGNSLGVALGFSTVADTIRDDWDAIIASMDDGSYKTKYSVGDTKLISIGTEGLVCATLVAMDADDLTGGGKAKMSWIVEELLNTSHRMNPSVSGNSTDGYVEGTGTIGGWEKSEMRSYLKDTIKPLIPENIRNRIAMVVKTQPAYDTTGASVTQTTDDDIWLPSYDELFATNGLYREVFPDNASRIKRKLGATSATYWWLRSANSTNLFRYVITGGDWSNSSAYNSFGVALGFCLN